MLLWLACRLAPAIKELCDAPPVELPDPSPHPALAERAQQAFAELAAVPFTPRSDISQAGLLMAMGCRELITREADQHPDTAGRTPTYERFPAFQEVEVPGADGVVLRGRHSTGAPGAPVVIVVHGLYDSHTSHYVVEYAEVLRRWGFHVFALDMRDHGRLRGQPPPPSLGLHEGRDLFAAASALSAAEGVSVGILGLSYGGQCGVRAAHEATLAGRPEVLRGGVLTISAPLNMHEAVLALDDHTRLPRAPTFLTRRIMGELYKLFDRQLQIRVRERGHLARPCEDYESYIREIVLPAYPNDPGLVGAFLGLVRCTQPSVLGRIAVPIALLHSRDDMLVPARNLKEARAAAGDNAFVFTRELPTGGHAGCGASDAQGTMRMLAAFFGRLRDG